MDSISVVSYILAIYSIILLVFGTIANIISIIICLQKRSRCIPTFVLMAYMLLCDTVSLYFWNLDHFLSTFYEYMIEFISLNTCRLSTFMQLFSLQSSVWLLVIMSIDRFLSCKYRNWRNRVFKQKEAFITGAMLIIIIFIINIHLVNTIDYSTLQNYTMPDKCFYTPMFLQWKMVHTYLYSIVPFIILIVVNGLLIHITTKNDTILNRSNEEKKKRRVMTLSIVGMSVSFITLTLPNAVAGGYFISELFQTATGTVILFVTDCLAFSYHGLNFVVFLILNKKFRREFDYFFKQFKKSDHRRRVNPIDATRLGNTKTINDTQNV